MKLTVLVIYYLIVLLIGYIASRRTNNVSDYVLGNRQFNPYVTALGAGASDMSGWLMLGLPGAFYLHGISEMWMPVGLVIGAFLNWTLVAKRLRIYSEVADNSLTLPSFLSNRFDDDYESLRLCMAVISLIFFTVYAASGLVGFALLFKVLFGLSYQHGLWIGLISIAFYTCIGGFIAVNWIDMFQGCLMFFALLFTPLIIWTHMQGGSDIAATLVEIKFNYNQPLKGLNFIGILSLLGWGLGYFGQPHILVRFMAAKKPSHMSIARNVCMVWMVLCLIGSMLVGIFGAAIFAENPLAKPETVFLQAANNLFWPLAAGVLFAAALSAIMSTISAQLLVCSSALIEDIMSRFAKKKLDEKKGVMLNRAAVVLVALVALLIASNPDSNVLNLVSYAWAGLGAAFGPVILLSLYWKGITRNGAVIGILLGGITVLVWKPLARFSDIFELYEIIPGFISCLIGCYLGSHFDSGKNRRNAKISAQFKHFKAKLQQQ